MVFSGSIKSKLSVSRIDGVGERNSHGDGEIVVMMEATERLMVVMVMVVRRRRKPCRLEVVREA